MAKYSIPNKPLLNKLLKAKIMNKIVTIDGKRGEYTGFSYITFLHYFSMYNGEVIRLSEMEVLKLFGIDFILFTHKQTTKN